MMKIFLINLDRSVDRLDAMKTRLDQLDLTFERVSAVDGSKLTEVELSVVKSPSKEFPNWMTLGEIGCFLSHRKCWQKLVDSEESWAVILEDDCIFSSEAAQYLVNSDWIPSECKLVQLIFTTGKTYQLRSIDLNENELCLIKNSIPVGAYAYVISREAAQLALGMSKEITEPVDNFLFGMYSKFSKSVACWRLKNAVTKINEEVATTIQGRATRKFTWFRIHPWRVCQKILMKFQKLSLTRIFQRDF